MGRFSSGIRTTNAPTATLPGCSIYASASVRFILREVHVFNTTTTACLVALRRLTSAGTQGGAGDELPHDAAGAAATATVVNSHTVGPTITTGEFARADLAAAVGGGIVWTFNEGIYVPAGTGQGVGILTPTGTGQVLDVTFIWDE